VTRNCGPDVAGTTCDGCYQDFKAKVASSAHCQVNEEKNTENKLKFTIDCTKSLNGDACCAENLRVSYRKCIEANNCGLKHANSVGKTYRSPFANCGDKPTF